MTQIDLRIEFMKEQGFSLSLPTAEIPYIGDIDEEEERIIDYIEWLEKKILNGTSGT